MLFYGGMLLLLFKIGKKIGNSNFQNISVLLLFGCSSDFLTSSITNIRAYTVGAVLVSFGFVMLIFMLISCKKGIAKIIITGAISILFGICLSPDSVIGILRKFMVNGAGAKDAQDAVSLLIIFLVASVIVCLVVLGYNISKK